MANTVRLVYKCARSRIRSDGIQNGEWRKVSVSTRKETRSGDSYTRRGNWIASCVVHAPKNRDTAHNRPSKRERAPARRPSLCRPITFPSHAVSSNILFPFADKTQQRTYLLSNKLHNLSNINQLCRNILDNPNRYIYHNGHSKVHNTRRSYLHRRHPRNTSFGIIWLIYFD